MINRIPALITVSLSVFGFVATAHGAVQASVKIEQISPSSYGTWTLLSEDGSSRSSKDAGVTTTGNVAMGLTNFGQTTLSVTTPAGMSAIISVYRGGELVAEVTSQQYSFPLYANDNLRILIKYSMSRVGSLGITSEPNGLRFRLKGPSARNYSAKTPHTFKELPAGKYSVYFASTSTCIQPAAQTIEVKPGERNTAKITLMCNVKEDTTVDRSRISKRSLRQYVEQRERNKRGNRK